MKLVSSALDNYRFSLVLIVTFIFLGLVSFLTMPRSEDPQLSFPINYIVALSPGTDTQDMEQLIADPMEEAINEIEDLKEVRTNISNGLVTQRVEFNYGTEPDEKYDDLVSALAQMSDRLPDTLTKLEVKKLSPSDVNIFQFALISESASYRELRLYAERFEKILESVNGIKKSEVWGIPDQQIQITVDFERVKYFGFRLSDALAAIRGEAENLPGGHVNVQGRRFTLKTSGKYVDIDAIRTTVIYALNGQPIYLKDIADVEFIDAEFEYVARYNGQRSIFITAMQNEGTNIYNIKRSVQRELDSFKQTLPNHIEAQVVMDQSKSVTKRLNEFFGSLLTGLLLVGAIVFLFMGVRNMIIVISVIPISILIGFGLLDLSNFGIEQMSIIGLIIALGLLVDNAIVVTDSIAQQMSRHQDVKLAAKKGTTKISSAVVSGTLTTLLAFLPVLAMQTNAGSFIRSLPLTVMYTLIASMFMGLLLTPLMVNWFNKFSLRRNSQKAHTYNIKLASRLLLAFTNGPYQSFLSFVLGRSKLFILLILIAFISTLSLFSNVGVSLFPKAENDRFLVNIKLPPNSNLKQTASTAAEVEAILAEFPNVASYATNIGRGNPRIYYSETPLAEQPNQAQIFVQVDTHNYSQYWQVVRSLRERLDNFTGAEVTLKNFQQGAAIEAPIVVYLFGDDFVVLQSVSKDIESLLAGLNGIHNVLNPVGEEKLTLKLNIDRGRAAQAGVSISSIDQVVRMSLVGLHVGDFQDNYGDSFKIVVRMAAAEGAKLADLSNIMVPNNNDQLIPLSQVASIELTAEPAEIQHYNSQRSAKITADVYGTHNVEAITQTIQQKLSEFDLPTGVRFKFGGERESRDEAFRGLIKSVIIALFGIFTVLVFQFRSFSQPVIVFVSIPFAISGAILALYFTGYSFSFMAFLGLAGLIGIVVNNSIILIDTANQLTENTGCRTQACLEACKTRLTPIILTSLTTVFSLLPIALQGSLTWSPLAWVIIGGMIVSTLISLIMVPVLYTWLSPTSMTQ
ncbi:efflux RND transporter permease subunit [Alteromonas macleodii]|uniref:Multidrug efflux pump subunit AcrB n=1 Tax=Alteromonas macleodii TaxID=28108 RepID=A0A6T9Y750_ALTMA|nr:efflux RND transporter permease subunit [Alteromonas macleodii]CAB9495196.1 conserved membrane protein of unknown function [Alteromonas macleodii]